MAGSARKRPSAAKKADSRRQVEELTEHIGEGLRTMFQDVVSEPVPERFQKLLDDLERKGSE